MTVLKNTKERGGIAPVMTTTIRIPTSMACTWEQNKSAEQECRGTIGKTLGKY